MIPWEGHVERLVDLEILVSLEEGGHGVADVVELHGVPGKVSGDTRVDRGFDTQVVG